MQRDALATKAAIDYDQSAVEDCELMVEPANGSGQYCRVGNGSINAAELTDPGAEDCERNWMWVEPTNGSGQRVGNRSGQHCKVDPGAEDCEQDERQNKHEDVVQCIAVLATTASVG